METDFVIFLVHGFHLQNNLQHYLAIVVNMIGYVLEWFQDVAIGYLDGFN